MSLVILIFYPSPAASLKRDADAALQDASLTLQQRAAFRYPNLPPPAAGPNRRSSANFATAANSCSKRSRTPACSPLPLPQANPIPPVLPLDLPYLSLLLLLLFFYLIFLHFSHTTAQVRGGVDGGGRPHAHAILTPLSSHRARGCARALPTRRHSPYHAGIGCVFAWCCCRC